MAANISFSAPAFRAGYALSTQLLVCGFRVRSRSGPYSTILRRHCGRPPKRAIDARGHSPRSRRTAQIGHDRGMAMGWRGFYAEGDAKTVPHPCSATAIAMRKSAHGPMAERSLVPSFVQEKFRIWSSQPEAARVQGNTAAQSGSVALFVGSVRCGQACGGAYPGKDALKAGLGGSCRQRPESAFPGRGRQRACLLRIKLKLHFAPAWIGTGSFF